MGVSTGATLWLFPRGHHSVCSSTGCFADIGPTHALLLLLGPLGGGEADQEAEIYPRPVAQPPCPDFARWFPQLWQPAHSCQQFPGCCHHRRCRWEAENRVSAGPQLSESPAQPFGCWDLQLLKLCLPFPNPFSPLSPGRLKPDKKGQMHLPLDKSLQVSQELLGTHT